MNKSPLIVLVEDNDPDVLLIRTALEETGIKFDLLVYSDGDEALDYLVQPASGAPRPDLLLMDMDLPKRSGREILEELAERASNPLPPFVVISSSGSQDDRDAATQLGAAHFFRKPTDLDEFMKLGKVVQKVLSGLNPTE